MKHAQPNLGRNRDRSRHTRIAAALLAGWFAFLFVGFSNVGRADAAAYDGINMSAIVGFNGFFGKNHWVPVRLRLENPGRAIAAELVVEVSDNLENGRIAQGTLRWPITLPSHSTIYKEIYVPGSVIDNASASCIADGQAIGAVRLEGNALGNTALVAVLSKEAQSAQFLTGSTGPGGAPVLPISVGTDILPQSANLLNDLAALVAAPTELNHLSPAQDTALLQWVKLGGLLIVTGTSGARAPWLADLPLLPGPAHQMSGDGLTQLFDSSVVSPPGLTTYARGVKPDTELWAGTSSLPLMAALPVGRGTIVQTSFLPSQPALLGWSSNAAFWTQVLKNGSSGNNSALPSLLDKTGVLSLATASDALTPLRIPSLRFWALLFALYALVVGPGVFFLLRRKKRETLAWVLLPAISILTTIGIYVFGASQRPLGVLTEGVGVMDLVGDGSGEVYGIRGFMSPYVSNTSVATSQPMLVLPLAEQNVRQLGTATVLNSHGTYTSFSDVGRWGVRYLYMAGAVTNLGELQTDLQQFGTAHDTFRGLVTNETSYTLHNVAMYWNGRMYALGNMTPSNTVLVSSQTTSQPVPPNWLSAYSSYNRDITHGLGRPLGSLANQLGFMNSDLSTNQAVLVATTDSGNPSLPKLVTNQKVSSSQGMVLVRQIVPVIQYPLEVTRP